MDQAKEQSQNPQNSLKSSSSISHDPKRNYLLGRPLRFGDSQQIHAIHSSNYFQVLDFDKQEKYGHEHYLTCPRCSRSIRIRKRWTREQFRIVTPRIHTCHCDQRVLVFRAVVSDWDEPIEFSLHDGDGHYIQAVIVAKFLGAYEDVDPLNFRNPDADPWPYYIHYNLLNPNSNATITDQ